MTIATVRRLAADIFGVGENKVKIDPESVKDAEGALTRSDVKGLIDKGIIRKAKPQGRDSTRRVGRTGHGRRRGTPVDPKQVWMDKVRSQRKLLNMLISSKAIKKETKRMLYYKIKSGIFRNKKAMLLYLKDNQMLPASYELPKPQPKEMKKPEQKKAMPKKEAPKPSEKAKAPEHKPAEHKAAEHKPTEHKAEHKTHDKGEHK